MIEIKSISGQVRFSTPINKGAKGKFTLMKEDYIVLPFSTLSPIPFKLGDYVDLSGILDESLGGKLAKIYEIVDLQKPTYNTATGGYDYELRLDAYYWKWKNKIFKYTPEHAGSEASWSLTATLDIQLGVFLRNLKALGYTYRGTDFTFSIDDTVENKAVAMTYDNMNLLDALFSMAGEDKWNCDCWITDNVIHFGRNEFGDAVKIERGVEASSITRSESQGTYATRIYAFGSTKNIPTNYRPTDEQAVINGVVQKRLMLPADTPYIDAYEGMSQEEAIEDVVVFDDVLPRRVGRLSDVKTVDRKVENPGEGEAETFKAYQYKDTELVFKEEYILEGQQLEITFQTGKLNGMRFGVHFEPEGTSEGSQIWEIVRNENYGRPLPDDTLYPEDGNEYFLSGFNIQMVSDLYIPEAEQELKEKAQKYADKVKKDDGTYPTTLKSSWVKEDLISRTFEFGQRINLVDDTYFEDGRISRVLGWKLNLDIPWDSPVYTIGESMPYSRIGDIEGKIDELTYKGQTYTGIGGGNVYIIRTNDSTAPSDSNVFSALRSLRQFTRKDVDDTVRGLLSMLKGIQSDDYSTGLLGTGFALKKGADGKSYAEVDRLLVRWQAVFNELNIKQTSYVGGEAVFSPASMQCVRVEETEIPTNFVQLADSNGTLLNDINGVALIASTSTAKVYRCYFKQNDGEKTIYNQFAIGDQAMCRQFNIKTDSTTTTVNRYYWRKVIGVGDDFIDLSVEDCMTGSDEPQAGDDIVTVGNATEPQRQNAIIISSYGEDAPSLKLYEHISDYDLSGKDVIVISPKGNKFKGDFFLNSGKNFFEFVQEGLKSKISQDVFNQTTSETNRQISEVSQKADKINLSVSELQKGYVNYLLNSGEFKNHNKWGQVGNNGNLRVENGLLKYSVIDWNYSWGHITEQISPNIKWEDGATYTFSVRMSANYTRDIKIGFRDSNGNFYYMQTFNVEVGTKVCTHSFTYNASNHADGKNITAFIIQTQTTEKPSDTLYIPPSVSVYHTILIKGESIPEWVACPDDFGNELVRTGIDIENRKITLQADTTVIRNNDGEEIVMITEDGKLSAEAIDTDTLVAKVVKTTSDGKRVEIFDNKLTMYDELGALKLVVSGDKLSTQPTGGSVTIQNTSNGSSGYEETYYSPEITLASIQVQADNNIVTIPRITININLGKETNNYGSAMVNMYLLLDGLLLARAFSTDGAAMSCKATATYAGSQISLSKGTHTLKYKFSGFAQGDPYNITASVIPSTGNIYVDYTQDLIEIASDGFRSSAGANNYLKHTASGTEIRCGNYGVKVTSSGIQRMRNGTTWENWQ